MRELRKWLALFGYTFLGERVLMKILNIILLLVGVIGMGASALAHENHGSDSDDHSDTMIVVYRGEKYEVPTLNTDYTDGQAAKIAQIMLSVEPPKICATFSDLISFTADLAAPGYGKASGGFGERTTLGQFTFVSVEVPKQNKHRTFVYRKEDKGAAYHLFDDFMYEGLYPPSIIFKSKGNTLLYTTDMVGHNNGDELIKKKIYNELKTSRAEQ